MADNILFTIVYPEKSPRHLLTHTTDAKTIRKIVDKVDKLKRSLGLATPHKDDLSSFARQTSPERFVRADLAKNFVGEVPKYGDPKVWQEASAKDLSLGTVFGHLTPLIDWAEQQLALTLAEMSILTGRIERTVDTFRADPQTRSEVVVFNVADDIRKAADQVRATQKERMDKHQSHAAEITKDSEQNDKREVGARDLLQADAGHLLKKKTTFKIKKPEET